MWKHNVFRASIFHLLFYICLFFKWWYHRATIPAWGRICQRTGSVQRKVTACDFFMSRPLVIFLSEHSLGDLFQFAADGQWPQEIRWAAVPPFGACLPVGPLPVFFIATATPIVETHWFSCLSLYLWQTPRPPPFSTLLLLKDQWRCTAASSKRAAHTQATIESGSWPSGRLGWAELFSEKKNHKVTGSSYYFL